MNVGKMNISQAIGSVVSIALYLFLPILTFSVIVPLGFTGETCLQLGGVFIVPLILLGLTLVISLLPIGPVSSVAGIVTGIALLIVGNMSKTAAGAKLNELLVLAEVTLDLSGLGDLQLGTYAAMLLKMSWGLILPAILMMLTAVVGLVVSAMHGNGESNSAGAGYRNRSNAPRESRRQTYPGSSTSSASTTRRSVNTKYHR